jgi:hypothetical protein
MTGWHGSGCAEDVLYLVIEDVSAESLHYRALCANAHEMRFVGRRSPITW